MAISVADGAGYIRSHICVEPLTASYDVVVASNFYNSGEKALERVEKITGRRVKLYETDLLDQPALKEVFDKEKIDSVTHFIGLKAAGESVRKLLEYYHNSITDTLVLCGKMHNHEVKGIVFSSSAIVCGDSVEIPITESYPEGEITNPYGRTKGMLEQILTDLHMTNPKQNAILLCYFNPISAHESELIGEDPKGTPDNLVPYIARVVMGKLDHLNVFGGDYGAPNGTGIRGYVHVVDLAEGHVKAVQKLQDKEGVSIHNLGTSVGYSVPDVFHVYEKAHDKTLKYEIQSRREGDAVTCYSDSAKTKRELGWVAEEGIEEMCADS